MWNLKNKLVNITTNILLALENKLVVTSGKRKRERGKINRIFQKSFHYIKKLYVKCLLKHHTEKIAQIEVYI